MARKVLGGRHDHRPRNEMGDDIDDIAIGEDGESIRLTVEGIKCVLI